MTVVSILRLSLRLFHRDLRTGELSMLAFALVIAVASVTTVGFFTERINQGINQQASEMIAADVVIRSTRPVDKKFTELAKKYKLRVSHIMSLRSVALFGETTQMLELKAVDNHYPLRGQLRTSQQVFADGQVTRQIPGINEVWVEAQLLALLKLRIGDKLDIGAKQFTVSRLLSFEPDRGGEIFSLAPRVLMNRAAIADTQLIQYGSRVWYRMMVAGLPEQVKGFVQQAKPMLQSGETLITVKDGRPELRLVFQRAENFLNLAVLMTVLLAGIAVAMSARRFVNRHLNTYALLRCLGARQREVLIMLVLEMSWLVIIAGLLGSVIGLIGQQVLSHIIGQYLLIEVPAATIKPLFTGLATGLYALVGFAFPLLITLRRVPPLRVLRRDITLNIQDRFLYLSIIAVMYGLLYWQVGDDRLAQQVMLAVLIILAGFFGLAFLLVLLIRLTRNKLGFAWRFGITNIARRAQVSAIQIAAIGLGLTAMLLLSIVHNEILAGWQKELPDRTPNIFLVNIQSEQIKDIEAFFLQRKIVPPKLFPVVRGRLLTINNKSVSSDHFDDPRAKNLINREFNLSWLSNRKQDNHVVDGVWWDKKDYAKPYLSLDRGVAKSLKVTVGDKLRFQISGTVIELEILNLREVDWGTFQANFFALVPPGVLENYPANWLSSLYVEPTQRKLLVELIHTFPNISVVDVGVIISRIRAIIDRVSKALEFIMLFTLIAGLVIMFTAIQSSQDERRHEMALMRTFGARTRLLFGGLLAEFILLGGLAGLLAGVMASISAVLLAEYIFRFEYPFSCSILITGMLSGVLVVGISGYLGTRRVLKQAPVQSLRQYQGL